MIFFRFVTAHAMTDRHTDRRTDRILIARPRLYSMQRGKKFSVDIVDLLRNSPEVSSRQAENKNYSRAIRTVSAEYYCSLNLL